MQRVRPNLDVERPVFERGDAAVRVAHVCRAKGKVARQDAEDEAAGLPDVQLGGVGPALKQLRRPERLGQAARACEADKADKAARARQERARRSARRAVPLCRCARCTTAPRRQGAVVPCLRRVLSCERGGARERASSGPGRRMGSVPPSPKSPSTQVPTSAARRTRMFSGLRSR